MTTAATPDASPAPPRKLGARRVIAAILAGILALAGFGIGGGGGAVLIANATLKDREGFFTSKDWTFTTGTQAITTKSLDVTATGAGDALETAGFATVRIRARGQSGRPIFVGIARTADVERYLSGVAHDQVTEIDDDPVEVGYRRRGGQERARPPAGLGFWVASVTGTGRQTLRWTIRDGDWSAVAMNADASPGVAIRADAGVTVQHLVAIGVGLLVGGLVLFGLGVLGVVLAVRRGGLTSGPGAPIAASPQPGPAAVASERPHAVHLDGRLDESRSRWLWMVKWLLLIPHYLLLVLLWLAFVVTTAVAFFAILVTGRYPRGIFDFNVGVVRWTWRVGFYSYSANGTDRYPPFSLGPQPDYPASLDIPYPERLSRGLVLVKWWLLAIPHYLIVGFFAGGPQVWGGGLICVLVLVSCVYLLVTGRPLRDLWDLVIGMNRWCFRVLAYAALMRDEYPPFRLTP